MVLENWVKWCASKWSSVKWFKKTNNLGINIKTIVCFIKKKTCVYVCVCACICISWSFLTKLDREHLIICACACAWMCTTMYIIYIQCIKYDLTYKNTQLKALYQETYIDVYAFYKFQQLNTTKITPSIFITLMDIIYEETPSKLSCVCYQGLNFHWMSHLKVIPGVDRRYYHNYSHKKKGASTCKQWNTVYWSITNSCDHDCVFSISNTTGALATINTPLFPSKSFAFMMIRIHNLRFIIT